MKQMITALFATALLTGCASPGAYHPAKRLIPGYNTSLHYSKAGDQVVKLNGGEAGVDIPGAWARFRQGGVKALIPIAGDIGLAFAYGSALRWAEDELNDDADSVPFTGTEINVDGNGNRFESSSKALSENGTKFNISGSDNVVDVRSGSDRAAAFPPEPEPEFD